MVILAQEFGSLLQSRLAGKLDLTFAARRWWDGRFFDHHNVGNSWDIYRLYLYESGWWIYGCTTDHVLELHFDGFSCANDRKCAVVWYIWWFDRRFQRASWALICWYLLFLYMNDPKWLGGMGATLHTHWTILQPSNVGMLWYGMLRELHIIPDHYIMICLDMLDFWGPLCMKHNQRPPAFFLVSCPLFLTRCQFFLDLGAHILVHNNIWEFTEIGMPQTRGCPTLKKKTCKCWMILKISIRVKQPFGSVYIYIICVCGWCQSYRPHASSEVRFLVCTGENCRWQDPKAGNIRGSCDRIVKNKNENESWYRTMGFTTQKSEFAALRSSGKKNSPSRTCCETWFRWLAP